MIELENNDNPDKKSITNNECLICLEELEITQDDIESNKINLIRLPCSCSSNIYHKECIKKMLKSGKNKNFRISLPGKSRAGFDTWKTNRYIHTKSKR